MNNQHISGTVQDVPTTSEIEKLLCKHPELHRINTQRNQGRCDLSRRCIGVWNYQGAFRQENACSQESTTSWKFFINEKKSNSKPVDSLSVLGYSISEEGIEQDHKHIEKIKMQKHQLTTNNSNRLLG